jgi:SH3-like domain-containing protein
LSPVLRLVGLSLAALTLLNVAPASAAPAKPAEQETYVARGKSGLPLPRFVSLKSGRVNSRIGPGVTYAVDWMYLKAGLPVEIIQEFDNWRKVRDADGAEGWINQSLLSSRRTAIVTPWQKGKKTQISLLEEPAARSSVVAVIEPGVVGQLKTCNGEWCEVTFDGHTGWMTQTLLWGAYPGEAIAD